MFDAFTGAAQRRDLEAGTRRANAELTRGLSNARGALTSGYDDANEMLQPFAQRGAAGARAYGELLGLEGADARADMQDVMTSDPIFQGQIGRHTDALLRNLNARGLSGSPPSTTAPNHRSPLRMIVSNAEGSGSSAASRR